MIQGPLRFCSCVAIYRTNSPILLPSEYNRPENRSDLFKVDLDPLSSNGPGEINFNTANHIGDDWLDANVFRDSDGDNADIEELNRRKRAVRAIHGNTD